MIHRAEHLRQIGRQRNKRMRVLPVLGLVLLSLLLAGAVTKGHALYHDTRRLLSVAKHALSSSDNSGYSGSMQAATPYIEHSVDTVVVDLQPLRTLPPGFFGVNYSAFWDSAQGSAASAQCLCANAYQNGALCGRRSRGLV